MLADNFAAGNAVVYEVVLLRLAIANLPPRNEVLANISLDPDLPPGIAPSMLLPRLELFFLHLLDFLLVNVDGFDTIAELLYKLLGFLLSKIHHDRQLLIYLSF